MNLVLKEMNEHFIVRLEGIFLSEVSDCAITNVEDL